MYSIERLRNIRAYDLCLFGGVPETADQMYERKPNWYTEIRPTRRGVPSGTAENHCKGMVVERIKINLEAGELSVTEVPITEGDVEC